METQDIHQHYLAVIGEHHVSGRDVSVSQVTRMQGFQRRGQRESQVVQLGWTEPGSRPIDL